MQINDNHHIIVVGLGDTGLSAVRWLSSRGARITVADTREHPPQHTVLVRDFPDIKLRYGPLTDQTFLDADVLVTSPGIPLSQPAIANFRQRGGEVIGDIELLARALAGKNGKIIAVTGTNGKSTVVSLVGHLCQMAGLNTVVAGNIGLPVLEALLACERKNQYPDVWVLELSSFQLETTRSLNATVSTVLNISEDHLDRYNDLLDYAHSKTAIFNGNGIQVLNYDDTLVRAMARAGRQLKWFSLSSETEYGLTVQEGKHWLSIAGEPLIDLTHIKLYGLHNAANALAAMALAEAIGLGRSTLLTGLASYRGLPHRVEFIEEINGITYINDSKGTNVGATQAALIGTTRPVVLIAGGDAKGQDFNALREVCRQKTRGVVLIGRDAALIHKALEQLPLPVIFCATLEEAVQEATLMAKPGDIVLLSPACASYDMFKDYQHRASVFNDSVRRMKLGAIK